MATLRELNPKVGDKFKRRHVDKFIVGRVCKENVIGNTHWHTGQVNICHDWHLDALDDWERIEESPETVTEPAQSTYAHLAAQYGIVIVADGVTYDGTKQ